MAESASVPEETASDASMLAASDTDAHAFRRVYDRHAEMVFGFFLRRGVEYHTALDLTAETFAASWLSRSRFVDRGDGNAGPWLSGIARNILSHAARHRAVATAARERLGMLAEPRAFDPVALDALDNVDGWSPEVGDALAGLNGTSRRAVELRVVHGSSYEEISETLGCTPLAARIKVSRALADLRAEVPNRRRGDDR
ncbi:MAG: RNA polymerase sigma factor [Ilumatobacteraceae bacterium]